MDNEFKEPRLELHYMINSADTPEKKEALRSYLVKRCNSTVYNLLVTRGFFAGNEADIAQMEEASKQRIEELKAAEATDPENENHVFDVKKMICEFYARSMDQARFKTVSKEIIELMPSLSLKMDIYLCQIRIAIILGERKAMADYIRLANDIFDTSCDWDRKNRFKIYLGLYNLIKADFKGAATLFSEGLASFDADELLRTDQLAMYLIFAASLSFSRGELSSKILENSEVRQFPEYLRIVDAYYNCEYGSYFKSMLQFIDIISADPIIGGFREHFCKEMKLRGYSQLLVSYQSVHLDRMAETFNIQVDHLEYDLCNFINEGRLNCIIDKVDGIVKIIENRKTDSLECALQKGDSILRNIKKTVN